MADHRRTEPPTGKRLERARREGQFITSKELVAAAQFFVFVAIIGIWFPGWFRGMKGMLHQSIEEAFHSDVDVATLPGILWSLIQKSFLPLSVMGGLTALATLSAHLAITRMGWSLDKFAPDFNRFNPATKISQIAKQAAPSVLQATLMLVLFGSTIYIIARQNAEAFLALPFASLDVGLQKVAGSLKDLLWKAAGVFVLFGIVDLVRQKRSYIKGLRMTKQEVQQEAKDSEVNPHVKGKIRRMRRDLARRRMMKEIPTATAVIVNPTHYAVAVRYLHESNATPMVVAKGKNYLALRIRQIAIENGVPLIENPPLAQALYKAVDVGREIPPAFYRAVAEVLAYVYKLTQARRSRR